MCELLLIILNMFNIIKLVINSQQQTFVKKQLSFFFQLNLNIFVFVSNVNDNPPVFDQNLYHVSVSEVRLS